ncbi:hypothetical protein TeGR_g13819, partial [Tetraparma gracilis]
TLFAYYFDSKTSSTYKNKGARMGALRDEHIAELSLVADKGESYLEGFQVIASQDENLVHSATLFVGPVTSGPVVHKVEQQAFIDRIALSDSSMSNMCSHVYATKLLGNAEDGHCIGLEKVMTSQGDFGNLDMKVPRDLAESVQLLLRGMGQRK